ncbi:MAG: hypothetical protein ACW99A_08215 [Candidatus Kariarchaeaceae archaeon]|jgi:hypothetical protein
MCLELKFSVANIDKWKANFEGNVGLRKEYGSRGAIAFTDPDSPNDVTIVVKAMNRANMAKANETGAFQNAMKESGILGEPTMRFLNYVTELDT